MNAQPRFGFGCNTWRNAAVLLLPATLLALAGASMAQDNPPQPRFEISIKDDKSVLIEPVLPVDPARRIMFQPMGLGVNMQAESGQTLHLSHFPGIMLDDRFMDQGQGARAEFQNKPLQPTKTAKQREGFSSVFVYPDNVRITATFTVVPTKAADKSGKRRRDAMHIHYLIENQGKQPHKVGLRVYMDTYIINNDGCLFAAPTLPGKILDGQVLKGKDLPPYVQLLQQPDLKNPGFVAHLTLDVGSKLEKPDRVVLTRHGAGLGGWDMPAQQAGGDSAMGVFWDPRELKPGEKREISYGYGQGIVLAPESEGPFEFALGGSFEPGKVFTVTAYVNEPAAGQFLTLELPDGMALVGHGKSQSVPQAREGQTHSVVFWQASLLRPGQYNLRIHSNTGLTQGKTVTVTEVKGR